LATSRIRSRRYNVFGSARSPTGTAPGLGFTGEQTDNETGFTYLRQRASIGAWTQALDIMEHGSLGASDVTWDLDKLRDAIIKWPNVAAGTVANVAVSREECLNLGCG
jgi:hypothetical protein